jgi:5-deoxy-glucuronate isomerase
MLPPGFDCEKLVVVEVYTPGGNWSSYPPHKHDVHTVAPDGALIEADLEEIYYYKFDKPGGYAIQQVYTADRSIDAIVRAQDNDAVLIPAGYHPVVSAHGFNTYYLNILAGSAQSLANTDDPQYAHIRAEWRDKDPRLPFFTHETETQKLNP